MATASPTQRTMEWLRSLGYTVDKVERRLPRGFVTVDCFGFADVLAIRKDIPGVLAVQATTGPHLHERVRKVEAEPRAMIWLAGGNRIWVVGWVLRQTPWVASGTGETCEAAQAEAARRFHVGRTAHRKRWTPRVIRLTEAGPVETESAILGSQHG